MKSTERNLLLVSLVFVIVGCTPIPVDYGAGTRQSMRASSAPSADNELLNLVGSARIGSSRTYADPLTGLTSDIRITSEYFSANGRSCRRYTQHLSNAAEPQRKLACRAGNSWQEIPVASIVE